jgi:hypothetical protein
MYPEGGCCRLCGSVFHKKADCPVKNKRDRELARLAVANAEPGGAGGDVDVDEVGPDGAATIASPSKEKKKRVPRKNKIVEFK